MNNNQLSPECSTDLAILMTKTSVEPMEEEEVKEESSSEEEDEEEEEEVASPFLGWENFDAYSNTLLPAGKSIASPKLFLNY